MTSYPVFQKEEHTDESDLEYDSSSDGDEMGDNYQVGLLWTRVLHPDDHEYPHDIEDFTEEMGAFNPPDPNSNPIDFFNLFAVQD